MILSTFDKELYERDLKEEAYEEGYAKGVYDKLWKQIKMKREKGKTIEIIADELEESIEVIEKIVKDMEDFER